MTTKLPNLDDWIERIKQATSIDQVWKFLAEFRRQEWTPEERAKIFHTYIKVVDTLSKAAPKSKNEKVAANSANDGPVWYEKM